MNLSTSILSKWRVLWADCKVHWHLPSSQDGQDSPTPLPKPCKDVTQQQNSPRIQSVSVETANMKPKCVFSFLRMCNCYFFIWETKSHLLSIDLANKNSYIMNVCFHFPLHVSKQCRNVKFYITLRIRNSQPSASPVVCVWIHFYYNHFYTAVPSFCPIGGFGFLLFSFT